MGAPFSVPVHKGVNACMTGKKERERDEFFVRLLIPVKKGEQDSRRAYQPEIGTWTEEWGKNQRQYWGNGEILAWPQGEMELHF